MPVKDFLPHFESLLGNMAWRVSSLVEGETPTSEKTHVDKLGSWLAQWAEDYGAESIIHPHPIVGDFVECRWNADLPGKPILICCHMDTVHPLGTVEKRPTHIEDDVLYGVGAYDMKASIALVQTVLEELQAIGQMPMRPIITLFTSDEEIGSPYSRSLIEQLALNAGLVLVMEFCNYEEAIVTARKGVGIFQITTLGLEAHSGSNPDDGVNAIVELAYQIGKVTALNNREKGTVVTPAQIRGGTAHNVIPGECDLVINVRVKTRSEAIRVYQHLEEISENDPFLAGAESILTGEYMRPPMERDDIMIRTFETLQHVADIRLNEVFRGGGSDANFAAALGVPTLDGLGPSGEGAHAAHEQVYLPSMPRRAALLASILYDWPHMPTKHGKSRPIPRI